jgi:hypothetical protein
LLEVLSGSFCFYFLLDCLLFGLEANSKTNIWSVDSKLWHAFSIASVYLIVS